MFTNGHKLIMDMGVDAVGHPLLARHYDDLLLGNMREDVYKVPLVERFMLGKGLTHYYRPGRRGGAFPFVPGAPARADWLFEGAVRRFSCGHARDAFFTLGRIAHLLSEMVAPVHAQVVLHWRGDGFEMVLERHHARLRALPLPPWPMHLGSAGALVHELAVFCQRFPCDRTRNVPGYLAYRLGLRRRPTHEEVEAQVAELVPAGGAYTAALCALFMKRAGVTVSPAPEEATARPNASDPSGG
jgi:hypothetical protein